LDYVKKSIINRIIKNLNHYFRIVQINNKKKIKENNKLKTKIKKCMITKMNLKKKRNIKNK